MIAWVPHHQLQQTMQLAILQRHPGAPQRIEVRKYLRGASHRGVFPADLDRIGPEVDRNVQSILQQAKIFIAGSVEGLDTWGHVERFFQQA